MDSDFLKAWGAILLILIGITVYQMQNGSGAATSSIGSAAPVARSANGGDTADPGWLVTRKYITAFDPLNGYDDGSEAAGAAASRATRRAQESGIDTSVHLIIELQNYRRIEWRSAGPRGEDSWCWTSHAEGDLLAPSCRYLAGLGRVLEAGEGPQR